MESASLIWRFVEEPTRTLVGVDTRRVSTTAQMAPAPPSALTTPQSHSLGLPNRVTVSASVAADPLLFIPPPLSRTHHASAPAGLPHGVSRRRGDGSGRGGRQRGGGRRPSRGQRGAVRRGLHHEELLRLQPQWARPAATEYVQSNLDYRSPVPGCTSCWVFAIHDILDSWTDAVDGELQWTVAGDS